jgi:signal transduction histidine kinase
MDQGEDLAILRILLVGICGMFIMAIAIILFFVIYQKRLLSQQKLQIEIKSEHQKELLRASLKSQEAERQRIARDLHDDVGALLSTSGLYLGQLMETPLKNEQLKLSEKVIALHTEMIQTIRNIAKDLRPVVLESLGFCAAVSSLAARINAGNIIKVEFEAETTQVTLDKNEQLELYRVVQELISNTIKHADANLISIALFNALGWVCLSYEDDGVGFDREKIAQNKEGLGLKNIESRIEILNGKIEYRATQTGTQLIISVPAPPKIDAL